MDAKDLYLDLLKRCLLNYVYPEAEQATSVAPKALSRGLDRLKVYAGWVAVNWLGRRQLRIARRLSGFDAGKRAEGRDWPRHAHTMIGEARLDNLRFCIEDVLRNRVPGDLIETGVWRGGATIFMRGVLEAHGVTDRTVYVADSFQGLPRPDAALYPADAGDIYHAYEDLKVTMEQVQENFRRYGLLDEQVHFLKGWFAETLPSAPFERLAVARLDGDMYGSTMDALRALYPKLSPGGYLIVDDYGAVAACRKAVEDFRSEHGIRDAIQPIDWTGVYWQRSRY
jgi:O-methyltransferase